MTGAKQDNPEDEFDPTEELNQLDPSYTRLLHMRIHPDADEHELHRAGAVKKNPGTSVCNKHKFKDVEQAKKALRSSAAARHLAEAEGQSSHKKEKRYYWCQSCIAYHTTSLNQEEYNQKYEKGKKGDWEKPDV